jgi:hypothetical protein
MVPEDPSVIRGSITTSVAETRSRLPRRDAVNLVEDIICLVRGFSFFLSILLYNIKVYCKCCLVSRPTAVATTSTISFLLEEIGQKLSRSDRGGQDRNRAFLFNDSDMIGRKQMVSFLFLETIKSNIVLECQ